MNRFCFLACMMAAQVGGQSWANDSTFGGAGANLFPIKNDDISMSDERISLQQDDEIWHVNVVFHFKNESSQKQEVTVGFPFSGRDKPSQGPEDFWTHAEASNFKTLVRGQETPSTKTMLAAREESAKSGDEKTLIDLYTYAYVWPVVFEPGETVEIVNSYDIRASFFPSDAQSIDYILKTGRNWKSGKIGRSQIELSFSKDVILCQDLYKYLKRPTKKDDEDFTCGGKKITPAGYQISEENGKTKISWDLKDFEPKEDVTVDYMQSFFVFESMIYGKDECYNFDEECGKQLSCSQLRDRKNMYRAMVGYPFQDEKVKAQFAKESWYKENKDFDASKLSFRARFWYEDKMETIDALEKSKGCK